MSLTDLQSTIEKNYSRPIRIQGLKRKREESLHDFLILFFTKWNEEKSTIYVDDREEQTDPGRRRSLGDIFMICKYYYPDVTLQNVVQELYVDLRQHFTEGFRSSYCSTIHKRVWYYEEDDDTGVYNKLNNDEYGNPWKWYLNLLGIEEPDEDDDPDEDYDEDGDGGCELGVEANEFGELWCNTCNEYH